MVKLIGKLSKPLYLWGIGLTAVCCAIMPSVAGVLSGTFFAMIGQGYYVNYGDYSRISGMYPGTKCLMYAPGEYMTVDDTLPTMASMWSQSYAEGFNKTLQFAFPLLLKTECGVAHNPDSPLAECIQIAKMGAQTQDEADREERKCRKIHQDLLRAYYASNVSGIPR
ncbi:hypothetical protein [Novosphingobium terrae]|uniref:hypothetical protein n=1 Tax=Novosphingobium terrae TaxID=2726189 RepID=UPI001980A650|nr:hypothetical protein [Novosphingobium terrae]